LNNFSSLSYVDIVIVEASKKYTKWRRASVAQPSGGKYPSQAHPIPSNLVVNKILYGMPGSNIPKKSNGGYFRL
jgi:hypothetical protein